MKEGHVSTVTESPVERVPTDVGTWLRRAAVASAIVVGLVPERWLHIHPDLRLVWAMELLGFAACGIAAVLPPRTTRPWTGTWCAAVVLWLLAPLGGVWGLLLRLPILQIAFLAWRSSWPGPSAHPDR